MVVVMLYRHHASHIRCNFPGGAVVGGGKQFLRAYVILVVGRECTNILLLPPHNFAKWKINESKIFDSLTWKVVNKLFVTVQTEHTHPPARAATTIPTMPSMKSAMKIPNIQCMCIGQKIITKYCKHMLAYKSIILIIKSSINVSIGNFYAADSMLRVHDAWLINRQLCCYVFFTIWKFMSPIYAKTLFKWIVFFFGLKKVPFKAAGGSCTYLL